MAEKTKYLWINNHPQNDQTVYVYYNERGEEIYGNTVTKSNVESPYSKQSIYKNPSVWVLPIDLLRKSLLVVILLV